MCICICLTTGYLSICYLFFHFSCCRLNTLTYSNQKFGDSSSFSGQDRKLAWFRNIIKTPQLKFLANIAAITPFPPPLPLPSLFIHPLLFPSISTYLILTLFWFSFLYCGSIDHYVSHWTNNIYFHCMLMWFSVDVYHSERCTLQILHKTTGPTPYTCY